VSRAADKGLLKNPEAQPPLLHLTLGRHLHAQVEGMLQAVPLELPLQVPCLHL